MSLGGICGPDERPWVCEGSSHHAEAEPWYAPELNFSGFFFTNEFWTRAKVSQVGKMTTNKLDLPWQGCVAEGAEDFSRMRGVAFYY